MSGSQKRKVGKRGQVTLPKELRDKLGIAAGDKVVVEEEEGKIVIKTPVTRNDLEKGYRERAEKMKEIEDEMREASEEADQMMGDAPAWE